MAIFPQPIDIFGNGPSAAVLLVKCPKVNHPDKTVRKFKFRKRSGVVFSFQHRFHLGERNADSDDPRLHRVHLCRIAIL